jgi:hypothetical protein
VTAKLEDRQSVTVSAPTLDLNSLVGILETLLSHAHQAQTEGLTLDAFLTRLKNGPRNSESAAEAAKLPVQNTRRFTRRPRTAVYTGSANWKF